MYMFKNCKRHLPVLLSNIRLKMQDRLTISMRVGVSMGGGPSGRPCVLNKGVEDVGQWLLQFPTKLLRNLPHRYVLSYSSA
jgi:hypothetical protein